MFFNFLKCCFSGNVQNNGSFFFSWFYGVSTFDPISKPYKIKLQFIKTDKKITKSSQRFPYKKFKKCKTMFKNLFGFSKKN